MIRNLFSARTPLLPRDAGGEAWLAALIAVLCFLACLAAVGAVSADRAAHGWARELRGEATVQVRPRVGETGAEAAARAAQTLAGVEGVSEAEAMDRETAEALLRPWIGDAVLPDLPIPYLVTVRLDRTAPASAVTLGRALAEAGLDATVDDHSLWRGEVERSASLITLLAAVAFLLTAGAAGAAVAYATRAGMAAQTGVIETLSLNGASDGAIAGLYQRRYGLLAAGAGAIGALVAMTVVAGMRFLGGAEGVTPALPLAWSDLLILSPCPLLAATVALVAARFTALARLKRGH
ncbi:MAG: ABC transporter permease [Brevundimonas sp.]|uniref:cell division protein FtsX n=1 Tax=Brevundimonas sp. TaxID=1871086 RepID=UPI00271725C7|nr:ABC transporter permease [Brevundimonas sp.]MDO9586889.1 ABC transporter permease [Brevundimonas sp.]MDP3657752.1 ABC transporter permease [Brevundimonas sp.]MDZ4111445.1 ABC transporter permease [Brevundimonas sp.]